MTEKELVKKLQRALGVKDDGVYGPVTLAAADKHDIEITVKKKLVVEVPKAVINPKDYFGATWMGLDLDLLGLYETDSRLVARYEPEWRNVGLPGYKGLAGTPRAWCAIRMTKVLRQSGVNVKGLTAGAASFSKWGRKVPFWFGASCDVKHGKNGGRHVCFFLYWIDEKKKIAATLDGNRGNRFCVAVTDLSGKHDFLVSGPRWPSEWPDGQIVSKEAVLAAYPIFKVTGSSGSSTR